MYMKTESLFSNAGEVVQKDLWRILVRYANGEDQAVEDYRKLLGTLGYCPRFSQGVGLPPFPIVGRTAQQLFAEQAHAERENVRILLNWFADPEANVTIKQRVVEILNERQGHYRRIYGSFPGGQPMERIPQQLEVACEFEGPLDPVCALLSDELVRHGGVATVQKLRPVRICQHCGKLFIRNRKSKFCPGGKCRTAHYNRRPQRANAEYQFERRIHQLHEKLTPKRFENVVRMRLANVTRGKLEFRLKRRRIRFLKEQLNAAGK
jgi:hypothetical protein